MSFARPRFWNRIDSQMAVLVLLSLIVIHILAAITFYVVRTLEHDRSSYEHPGEIIALMRVIAATPHGAERDAALARVAHAFPRLELTRVSELPAHQSDEPAHFFKEHLGEGFEVSVQAGERQIAVRLPDGDVVAARMPLPPTLPPPGNLARTIGFIVLFSVISVTLLFWAARSLRTPLSDFAAAAESFSLDGRDAPLPDRGPEEIRAVARAFNRMRERIHKLVDDRTRMFAAMGHDLRTPITRLRLRSEFIADEDLRKQMLGDLDQMKAMTESVLSFLRDGRTQEAKTTIDLASVLQTVCDQFADMGHTVSYAGPDHATIAARPDDLQRAVSNLVDNAVRHGTTVVVRLTVGGDSAIVTVEDDGPGIADCRKEAMLEAFVRGDEARTMDDRSGFGLGLSIARAIAEAHGGTLSLHDRVPQGLIARITLPAR